jgi:hydrogenase-4 component F
MREFILLIILPFVMSALCWFIKSIRIQYALSLAGSVLHLAATFAIFIGLSTPDLPFLFSTDSLSRLFLLVLSNVYFWVVLISYSFLRRPSAEKAQKGKKIYFFLLNFYLCANTAAILSNHFGMYWVAAEMTTLSVAPLIYYYRNPEALEAMWKYLFLVSVGIAFAFIGILFLALSAQGTPLEGKQLFFSIFVDNARSLNPVWLKASFIFIFVGLSTKIGIAPMHSGDIDATSNSPSPVAALMSGSLRITALLGVLRILQIIHPTTAFDFSRRIVIVGGLLSLTVAFLFMFRIRNYKRLLAYSSVEHLGLITLGIGIGGLAFIGSMYHIVYNSITKVSLFLNAGNIHQRYKTREVDGVRGVIGTIPWTGWLFLLSFLAISAAPPFGIFFSELKIFEGMLLSDKPWVLAITMFLLLFIFINMGRAVFRMLYGEKNTTAHTADATNDPSAERERFGIIQFASITLLVMMIAIAIISPDILKETIMNISRDFGISL